MRYAFLAAASFLAAVFLFGWEAATVGRTRAQPPAEPSKVSLEILAFLKPVEIAEGDSELQKKLKERHNVAVKMLEGRINEYKRGVRDFSSVFEIARLAADAKLDLAENEEARIAVLQKLVNLAKGTENNLAQQLAKGFGSKADFERSQYARLTLEVDLLRAKQKLGPGQD